MVAPAEGAKRKVTKLQIKKQMEIIPPEPITKLLVIPKLVNGRIELHLDGLPEGTAILHTLQVTDPSSVRF